MSPRMSVGGLMAWKTGFVGQWLNDDGSEVIVE